MSTVRHRKKLPEEQNQHVDRRQVFSTPLYWCYRSAIRRALSTNSKIYNMLQKNPHFAPVLIDDLFLQ